jgi:hypothetical protein
MGEKGLRNLSIIMAFASRLQKEIHSFLVPAEVSLWRSLIRNVNEFAPTSSMVAVSYLSMRMSWLGSDYSILNVGPVAILSSRTNFL